MPTGLKALRDGAAGASGDGAIHSGGLQERGWSCRPSRYKLMFPEVLSNPWGSLHSTASWALQRTFFMDRPCAPGVQWLCLTAQCGSSTAPLDLVSPFPALGMLRKPGHSSVSCCRSLCCSIGWGRAGVTLLGTLGCVWVLIFGAIRLGTEPKSHSNWPRPVIFPDKTIKFLRQEMFFANRPCQMLLLFISVVFKDLFLILTHYFMRHRPVLTALLKLSITLMLVCCLRASLALRKGLFFFSFLPQIILNKHS